ncbi:Aldo/keto reductase [Mycena amicta]|nr:Aldo/keto reductase [Mycena amicta]
MPTTPKNMKYVRLGNSGLKISQIILGCMTYGNPTWNGGWVLGEEEALKHIKEAYDLGINAFDTADGYSNGESEVILGRAVKKLALPREEIVIMTKLCGVVSREPTESMYGVSDLVRDQMGYTNQYGLSRKHIFDSVKASLGRLDLEYIDLLQCHRFDYNTPIEETMQALHDVVKATFRGYVRYIGMSSCYAYQYYAINHNLTPFISMQNQYCLVYREEEREMFPTLKHFDVGSIPWSTLARSPSKPDAARKTPNLYTKSAANQQIVERVEEIANKRGISMAQVSVAWVLSKSGVSAPIVGTTSLDNLRDITRAIDVQLTEDEIKYLEEPYQPLGIFGHS